MVADAQALDLLRGEWNALLQSSRADTIFLTWEWITTWWTIYGAGSVLHVLTARSETGALVGLAPLKRVRRGLKGLWCFETVEFIGQGGDVTPEYLDFIAAPGFEARVVEGFADLLLADNSVGAIDLRPMPAESPSVEVLSERLHRERGRFRSMSDALCPILNLPPSVETFLAGQSRNYRKKMKEYERRCERDLRATVRLSTTTDELRSDMGALIELHHQRWDGYSRAFRSSRYIEFHERLGSLLLDRGWMRLFSLRSGSRPLAVLYCFAYGGRYYYYQAGRDPALPKYRLGLVLMHKAIQHAVNESAAVFDFLRGDEQYKYHWAKDAISSVRVVYWKSLSSRAALYAHSFLGNLGGAAQGAAFRLAGTWRRPPRARPFA